MNLFKKHKKDDTCDQSEHCPIYLAYLGKYGENSEEIKMCKNPSVHYCKKYNLINPTEWDKLTVEEKLKLVKDMEILNFIKKKNDL